MKKGNGSKGGRGGSGQPYDVGYGKPPASGKFAKGRSGNPNGRPKRKDPVFSEDPQSLEEILADCFLEPILVNEGGQIIEMARDAAYFRMLEKQAALGKVTAMRELFRLKRQVDEYRQAQALARAERIEANHAFWKKYCGDVTKMHERAKSGGKPVPEWLPHVEDVVFTPGEYVAFIGHNDEESYAHVCRLRNFRDLVIILMVEEFDRPGRGRPESADAVMNATLALVGLDRQLPTRWRRNSPEVKDWESRLTSTLFRRAERSRLFQANGVPESTRIKLPPPPAQIARTLSAELTAFRKVWQ